MPTCSVPPSDPTARLPTITPTKISMSATEIPVRIEIRLAIKAKPIQIQAMNQTLLSIMTPSFCRSHQLKCGSSSAEERQTPLPNANARWGIGAAQAFGAGGHALTRSSSGSRFPLTAPPAAQKFLQFFVSLNGSASGRSNGGTKFRRAKAVRIGANDARHREHLMAPA